MTSAVNRQDVHRHAQKLCFTWFFSLKSDAYYLSRQAMFCMWKTDTHIVTLGIFSVLCPAARAMSRSEHAQSQGRCM